MIFNNDFINRNRIMNEAKIINEDAIKFAQRNYNGSKLLLYVVFESENGLILLDPSYYNILNEGNNHNIDTWRLNNMMQFYDKYHINFNKRRFILITENHAGHGPRMKISNKGKQFTIDWKSYYEIFIKKEINHDELERKKSVDDYIDITNGVEVLWGYSGNNKIIKTNELNQYKYLYVRNLNLMKLAVENQKYNYPFSIEQVINIAFINDENLRYNDERRVARFMNGDVTIYRPYSRRKENITDRDIDVKFSNFNDIIRKINIY